jgi:choline dehydrogenase-like flavoprotein
VILEPAGSEWFAKGVRFEHGGTDFMAKVAKEVIVSCGSVASPQLLELSGIGDPKILEEAEIPVKVNNPNVGTNFQDHMSMQTDTEHLRKTNKLTELMQCCLTSSR